MARSDHLRPALKPRDTVSAPGGQELVCLAPKARAVTDDRFDRTKRAYAALAMAASIGPISRSARSRGLANYWGPESERAETFQFASPIAAMTYGHENYGCLTLPDFASERCKEQRGPA
jgi:hypothetical protein